MPVRTGARIVRVQIIEVMQVIARELVEGGIIPAMVIEL
jgi:hypothetical protein